MVMVTVMVMATVTYGNPADNPKEILRTVQWNVRRTNKDVKYTYRQNKTWRFYYVLTDAQIGKRLRGQLARCGIWVHKVKCFGAPDYITLRDDSPIQSESMNLNALETLASLMMERRRDHLAAR